MDALGGSDVTEQLIIAETFKRKPSCLYMCHHLTEGEFFTTTYAFALSLSEACKREVWRAELVEIFECVGFFWILEKGRI